MWYVKKWRTSAALALFDAIELFTILFVSTYKNSSTSEFILVK